MKNTTSKKRLTAAQKSKLLKAADDARERVSKRNAVSRLGAVTTKLCGLRGRRSRKATMANKSRKAKGAAGRTNRSAGSQQRVVRMPGVEIIPQYRVTRKCGCFEERPITYRRTMLKQLTQTPCDACKEAS